MANYKVTSRLLSLMCLGIFVMAVVPVVQAQDWGWPEQDKLTASDGAAYDEFGYAVSVSDYYAIVGAAVDDDNGNNSGSAYILKKSDAPDDPNWYEKVKLTASDGDANDFFGLAVSVSGDYAVVGADHDDDNGNNSGSVYIFKKSHTTDDPNWYEQVKLTASDGDANDWFGRSVSISGNYAIVAAYWDDDNGRDSGSAYIFRKSDIPCDPNWYEQAKLTASDGTVDDWFGRFVSISGDYAIVGADGDDDNGSGSGSAYIFKKSDTTGDPNWYEQVKLTASDGDAGNSFGIAVSVSGDYAVVGAHRDDDNGGLSGSAYIFRKSNTPGDPNWYEHCKLTASDGGPDDFFGYAVSVSGDYAIVGAPREDDYGGNSGSAYIFRKSNTPGDPNWYEQVKLTASDGAAQDRFGFAVSVCGDYAVVGADLDDDNGNNSGSAYIFKLTCPPADLDGDCYVDFKDFAVFARYWLEGIE